MVDRSNGGTAVRCIAFDFDGTLVDSNRIKRDTFFEVAAAAGGSAAVMEQVLRETPGDRFAIFRRFVEGSTRLRVPAASNAAAALSADYSRRCEEAIAACPSIRGAEQVLADLPRRGIAAALISATPSAPLEALVARRGWRQAFGQVMGGAIDKAECLRELASRLGVTAQEMVMVGDHQVDKSGADDFGCRFVAVLSPDNDFTEPPPLGLTDLTELSSLLGLGDFHA